MAVLRVVAHMHTEPAGAVMPREMLQKLIHLADEHDFLIASDECYSEIYLNENILPSGCCRQPPS